MGGDGRSGFVWQWLGRIGQPLRHGAVDMRAEATRAGGLNYDLEGAF